MSSSIIQAKVVSLKTQRDALAKKQQQKTQTITASALGGLITWKMNVPVASDVTSITAMDTADKVSELKTVLAGQSAEIAELKQCLLVLAKSTGAVEKNTGLITAGIDNLAGGLAIVKEQTAPKVRPWDSVRDDLTQNWTDLIEDTLFFNHDAAGVTVGRGFRAILSFGTAAPEAIHAAKRECFSHLKTVRAYRDRLKALHAYGMAHYKIQTLEWLTSAGTLTVNGTTWSLEKCFEADFLPSLQKELYALRKLPI